MLCCCGRQCNRRSGVVGVVNDLYVGAFQQFYTTWRTQHNTVADSGFVLAGLIPPAALAATLHDGHV